MENSNADSDGDPNLNAFSNIHSEPVNISSLKKETAKVEVPNSKRRRSYSDFMQSFIPWNANESKKGQALPPLEEKASQPGLTIEPPSEVDKKSKLKAVFTPLQLVSPAGSQESANDSSSYEMIHRQLSQTVLVGWSERSITPRTIPYIDKETQTETTQHEEQSVSCEVDIPVQQQLQSESELLLNEEQESDPSKQHKEEDNNDSSAFTFTALLEKRWFKVFLAVAAAFGLGYLCGLSSSSFGTRASSCFNMGGKTMICLAKVK